MVKNDEIYISSYTFINVANDDKIITTVDNFCLIIKFSLLHHYKDNNMFSYFYCGWLIYVYSF